ncbi:hypothetical protein ACTSKR_09095 [Chitinibacteraceae bacterium HSL-7]
MSSQRLSIVDFDRLRHREGWVSEATYTTVEQFTGFVVQVGNKAHIAFGTFAMKQVNAESDEIVKLIRQQVPGQQEIQIQLDQSPGWTHVSVYKPPQRFVMTWRFRKSSELPEDLPSGGITGSSCLSKLAQLAQKGGQGARLIFSEQTDNAFMWKAPSFHPLQVLENVYQRVVRQAGEEASGDKIQAQTDALSLYFINQSAEPAPYVYRSPDINSDSAQLASVKMNHLIDSFYLFRLLVSFRAESEFEISDDLRAELSGNLTKILHSGRHEHMGWLYEWLPRKVADLGRRLQRLNKPGQPKLIFFLKGGRALNYFLGTPEKGENDWDTQVVIDPNLSAEDWYQCLAEVHDVLLEGLAECRREFSDLVEKNALAFSAGLDMESRPSSDEMEVEDFEVFDGESLKEHANCKAELIDIGIPRRDSPFGVEEWSHLSVEGGLLTSKDGVIYPCRSYYLSEYLMMVREAFANLDQLRKAPKRIARLGLILNSENGRDALRASLSKNLAKVLPGVAGELERLSDQGTQELYKLIAKQFVEAYNLHRDVEMAKNFDGIFCETLKSPPDLPTELQSLLQSPEQIKIATIVGVAHALSDRMTKHWTARNAFFETHLDEFKSFIQLLALHTSEPLRRSEAQFAVAGSYAIRLQAEHLRFSVAGMEPIRRILVKLQCPVKTRVKDLMTEIHEIVAKECQIRGWSVTHVSEQGKESLLIHWDKQIQIGEFAYRPLVMKIRIARQRGDRLPVLSSIQGMPVVDLRYLVSDYRNRTSRIDELGARRVLVSATGAISELLSRFDFDSDDQE